MMYILYFAIFNEFFVNSASSAKTLMTPKVIVAELELEFILSNFQFSLRFDLYLSLIELKVTHI